MKNNKLFYHLKYTNTLSSLLNDAATTINETCDNSNKNKIKHIENINKNVNTCSCMLQLVLLQVVFINEVKNIVLQILKHAVLGSQSDLL